MRVVLPSALTVRTVTDAKGHYRLDGAPLGQVTLDVIPPTGTRDMPAEVNLSTRPGTTVEEREIAVPVGVLVRGRAIDERTGKPVEGTVKYFAYETNPELQKSQELTARGSWWRHQGAQTDAEGRFAIAVLSGPGILAVRAGPQFRFGVGAEQINCPTFGDALNSGLGGKLFRTVPRYCQSQTFNLLVPVNPRPEAEDMAVDLKLRSGVDVIARVRTSDGQPLGTYYELGAMSQNSWMEQNEDRFTIVGCYPEETRRVFSYQPARNLVAFADVTGVPPEPIEFACGPGRRSSAGCWTRKAIPSRMRRSSPKRRRCGPWWGTWPK